MNTFRIKFLILAALLMALSLGCQATVNLPSASDLISPDSQQPGASQDAQQPEAAEPVSPAEAEPAGADDVSGQADSQPAPAEQEVCQETVCFLDQNFPLLRPIGTDGRNTVDTTSRFGTLRRRVGDAYHGVQFLNSTGTPVFAAAAGDVVVAGDDSKLMYGPRANMYGNLVIIRHSLPGIDVPVYTVYSHLSEINVKAEGDVEAGQQIGLVGSSGSVRGSTLGFEVRYGENSYEAAVNPELWLEPMESDQGEPLGALIGRVEDGDGNLVSVSNILVENLRLQGQEGRLRPMYLRTYLDQAGNQPWQENFAASNLLEGTYQISIWRDGQMYQREVEIQPGKLTFVNFVVE